MSALLDKHGESSELAPETVARVRAGLVVGLVAVAGVAFVVSWTALHDVGCAIGLDAVGAVLYPLSADGPIGLALVASLVLAGRHRRAALTVLVLYTFASLALNYVHGLVPLEGTRPRLSPVPQVHWVLVGVAAALPVGSIACCADLVTRVLRSARPAVTASEPVELAAVEPQVEPVDTPADAPVDTSRRWRWGRKAAVPVAQERSLEAICVGSGLYWPAVPAAPAPAVEPEREYQPQPEPEPEPEYQPQPVSEGLSAEQAAQVIEQCWREGVLSIRKTAELADRSKSFVDKCFAALATEYGPRPEPQQMALQGVAA
ncbi:DUF2637 domain-containing protein [Streptomyces sioyaensis]|uniref:DUF2637 domain-containing protein n=1 Tax=Streptomyces sioyaensis TaxID=67364 RepID=UPI0033CF5987